MPPSAGSKGQPSQVTFLIKPSIALKCNVSHWTNWSPCCKGETARKKVVLTSLEGKPGLAPICKTKKEVFNCDQDQCAGEWGLQWCKGGLFVISKWCCKKWLWSQILLGHLVSEAQLVRVGYKVSSKHIAPSPILWRKICVVQLSTKKKISIIRMSKANSAFVFT